MSSYERPIVMLDFETTGLSPEMGDRITEVAALRIVGGEITERYVSLVNCGVRIPSFITGLTGITQEMVDALPEPVPRREPLNKWAARPYEVLGRKFTPMTELAPFKQRGKGSWYGTRYHGKKGSIGEPYDMLQLTAAHPTLPLPSYARVTNLENGKSVVVRLNDRGPFLHDRIIDLSFAAAMRLGYANKGSADLEVELLLP